MNSHAGNPGNVLKHLLLAELIHLIQPTAFLDTHAGRPWNEHPVAG